MATSDTWSVERKRHLLYGKTEYSLIKKACVMFFKKKTSDTLRLLNKAGKQAIPNKKILHDVIKAQTWLYSGRSPASNANRAWLS